MWHNILNIGDVAREAYAIYGPPEHPHGTVDVENASATDTGVEADAGLGVGSLLGRSL